MTFLRQLAVKTLRTVIWLSSPITQIWAQAMLAELDSITSDWKALLWAIGSLRVLFVRQTREPASLSDIPAAAKDLADRMTQRTWLGSVSVVGMAFFFGRYSLHAPNTLQRIGATLLVVALLYMLLQLVTGRPRRVAPTADLFAQSMQYRSELIRERDFHRGRSFWSRLVILIPGFILLSVGGMVTNPSTLHNQVIQLAFFFLFILLAIPNNVRFAKRYSRQLRELELLQLKG
jgi:hypothetical protein